MERVTGIPLIVTDGARVDEAAVDDYALDLAFGDSEQSFEATFETPRVAAGAYLYIDGTEFGGIVDGMRADTESTEGVTYTGRTWHGILAGKIVRPDSGQAYYTSTGDLNACIGAVLSRVGVTSLFRRRAAAAGVSVSGYKFERYTDAYSGLKDLCKKSGCALHMSRHDGYVEVWGEATSTYSNEVDSDLMDFANEAELRPTNHLVCLGKGEGAKRTVIDLYADANGNVSRTQTFTGIDEVAEVYDYASAEADELLSEGTERLQEMQTGGSIDVTVTGASDWCIGDRIVGQNSKYGVSVTATISKKIVKVEKGVMSVSYEVGDARSTISAQAERYEGAAIAAARQIAEDAHEQTIYVEGDNIDIDADGRVISAPEMTYAEITALLTI